LQTSPVAADDEAVKTPLRFLAVLLAAIPLCTSGCQYPSLVDPGPPPGQSDYVFVWLKTGPHSAEHTDADRKSIFEGHMANMKKLSAAHALIVAGPFGQGRHDAEDRGIFVFDVSQLDAARLLVDTDPGVESGEFRAVMWPMRSSSTLRNSLDLDRQRLQGRAWTVDDGRVYQLVTVKDMDAAESALAHLEDQGKVIWSGRFGGDADGWGVFVLDADSAQDAVAVLGPDLKSMGECWIDPWFSTKSLEGLRDLRKAR
jgi:uncharacterized protein YciI